MRDGKILRVSGNCRLREVLQKVGLGDRVDDVHSVRNATTDTSSKQDAELDEEVQLHAQFKRRHVYFLSRIGQIQNICSVDHLTDFKTSCLIVGELFNSSTNVEFVLSGC